MAHAQHAETGHNQARWDGQLRDIADPTTVDVQGTTSTGRSELEEFSNVGSWILETTKTEQDS